MDQLQDNLKSKLEFEHTWFDIVAKVLTRELGSVWFLWVMLGAVALWMVLNLGWLGIEPFDPYPFVLLASVVAIIAMLLAVVVLISQNRQGKIAEIRQQIDFEINVRTEEEVTKILNMVDAIHREMGIAKKDSQLEEMKQSTDIATIKEEIEQVMDKENETKK
jgi:uncharacterized membrane protein